MSNKDMSAFLDVSRNTITNYVRGHRPVPRSVILSWAQRTGVDPEWLEYGEDNDSATPSTPDDEGGKLRARPSGGTYVARSVPATEGPPHSDPQQADR